MLVTTKHLFALFLVWAACAMVLPEMAVAQNQIRVQIRNASSAPLQIMVYDDVCRQTVFNGALNSRAQRPLTLCPDRRSLGNITVIDRFGEQQSYRVRQGQVLSLRARYGSGGLGR